MCVCLTICFTQKESVSLLLLKLTQLKNCHYSKMTIVNYLVTLRFLVIMKNFISFGTFIKRNDTDNLCEITFMCVKVPVTKYVTSNQVCPPDMWPPISNFTYVSDNAFRRTLHRCIHSRLHQCHNNFFHFDKGYLRNHLRLLLRVVLIVTPVKKFLCSTYLFFVLFNYFLVKSESTFFVLLILIILEYLLLELYLMGLVVVDFETMT